MITDNPQGALCRTAVQIFEDLAFMLPTLELREQQLGAGLGASVSIGFSGYCAGRLSLSIADSVLPELTANMLGETEIPSQLQQRDALGELANVICGNLLPRLFGAASFRLDPPDFQAKESFTLNQTPIASSDIGLGNGRAQVMLFVDRYGNEQ